MLARVRETEGGYRVTLYTAEGEVDSRVTTDLAEAFRWQSAGTLPPVAKSEPKGKKK